MMIPPPFFRPTYPNFRSNYGFKNTMNTNYNIGKSPYFPNNFSNSDFKSDCSNNDFNSGDSSSIDRHEEYDNFFNILGFKLYFDDLLILAVLFFLYKEDVEDTYLYIILVILLLS